MATGVIVNPETAGCAPGPALLLGDLNSAPDSAALETLRGAGWKDVWAMLRPADPGFTFEADRPTQRIDYALASAESRARVHAIERVEVNGRGPPRLSDHLGLLVTLEDEEPPSGRVTDPNRKTEAAHGRAKPR